MTRTISVVISLAILIILSVDPVRPGAESTIGPRKRHLLDLSGNSRARGREFQRRSRSIQPKPPFSARSHSAAPLENTFDSSILSGKKRRAIPLKTKRGIHGRLGLAANPGVSTRVSSTKVKRDYSTIFGLSWNREVLTWNETRKPEGFVTHEAIKDNGATTLDGAGDKLKPTQPVPTSQKKAHRSQNEISTDLPKSINLNSFNLQKTYSLPLYRPKTLPYDLDVHPGIQFQQHLNHALRRYARFLGKPIDDAKLAQNLRRRAESLDLPFEESNLRRRDLPIPSFKQNSRKGYPHRAYQAYKKSTVTAAGQTTAANSVGLSIEANDVGYFAEILVGTPPSKFRVLMDSGSGDTWVHLPDCRSIEKNNEGCNHPSLNTSSSTFRRTNTTFKTSYGTGHVEGVIVADTLTFGGLVLTNHAFGGVTRASEDFTGKDVPFEGIIGTGKSILSNQKLPTPIESLAKSGALSGAFLGYSLGRVSDDENIGQITVGGVDQTKFSGDLTLVPNVNEKGFWEAKIDTIQIDKKNVLKTRTGILDTGTTLIVAPLADVEAVHAKIPGSFKDNTGAFIIPCTTKTNVALSFAGVSFEINPVDLTFKPTSDDLSGNCTSGITAGDIGPPGQWLLGDMFLKNVYFATDATNNQIGLAAIIQQAPKGS